MRNLALWLANIRRSAVLGRKVNRRALWPPDHASPARAIMRVTAPLPEVRILPIASIRTDGDTQHRIATDADIVRSMQNSCERALYSRRSTSFGTAKTTGCPTASNGSMRQSSRSSRRSCGHSAWHSEGRPVGQLRGECHARRATECGRNRTGCPACIAAPQGCQVSNVQLAKHLHVPEPTVRRLRQKLSSSRDERWRPPRHAWRNDL